MLQHDATDESLKPTKSWPRLREQRGFGKFRSLGNCPPRQVFSFGFVNRQKHVTTGKQRRYEGKKGDANDWLQHKISKYETIFDIPN